VSHHIFPFLSRTRHGNGISARPSGVDRLLTEYIDVLIQRSAFRTNRVKKRGACCTAEQNSSSRQRSFISVESSSLHLGGGKKQTNPNQGDVINININHNSCVGLYFLVHNIEKLL
jgi:hypothetical protein